MEQWKQSSVNYPSIDNIKTRIPKDPKPVALQQAFYFVSGQLPVVTKCIYRLYDLT